MTSLYKACRSLVFGSWVYLFASIPLNLPLSSTFPRLSWHSFYVFFTSSFTSHQLSPLRHLWASLLLKKISIYASIAHHPLFSLPCLYKQLYACRFHHPFLSPFLPPSLNSDTAQIWQLITFRWGPNRDPCEKLMDCQKFALLSFSPLHSPQVLCAYCVTIVLSLDLSAWHNRFKHGNFKAHIVSGKKIRLENNMSWF